MSFHSYVSFAGTLRGGPERLPYSRDLSPTTVPLAILRKTGYGFHEWLPSLRRVISLHPRSAAHGKTATRRASRDFIAFLEEVVSLYPLDSKFISSSTTSPPIKPIWFALSSDGIRACSFITVRRISSWLKRSRSSSSKSSALLVARKLRHYINAQWPMLARIGWK